MPYELLTQRSCRWSIRNIVALTEKGADFRLVDVSAEDGQGKAAWYQPLNPFGRTPALRHGEVVIVESLLMNEYIDETATGRPLLPATPAGRAWARAWNGHNDHTLMPRLTRLVKADTDAGRAQVLAELNTELARAEARAFEHAPGQGRPFWHGECIGLVDIGWWTFFQALGPTLARLGQPDAVLAHPRLAAWREALLRHPAFDRATQCLDGLQPLATLTPAASAALRP